ncbi:type 1 glutamine amidotransferase domain-containing protein [Nocardioides nitrophenolicus]|uniref:type 1 glutamine amidotransferase domain-containing protein n=1 Tax=Nocardioides nitrophenolicus TaxID=60489 RepID=UPI00195B483B|nr:type 1 glutamine amidotransferase domain-containing protein [Nocardioides nitrophenolicus]MBM7515713.1 putative intracellular protease/amidase [Nocardioides nitrophenolicus]
MTRHILHVVTNVGHYDDPAHPTGLWLSELTHAWHVFEEQGYEQTLVSPAGGAVPLEPRALKFPNDDKTAKAWRADPAKLALLESTASPDQIDPADYDAIYFTGGHAVMYDFPGSEGLQRITREIYERGGVVSSVCHGYCGLLDTRLSDGSYLIDGKRMTGFAWSEEVLARVDKLVPYNAEERAKQRGARYQKAKLPFVSYTVTDENLVTGQNPGSAKATARAVVAALEGGTPRGRH